MANRQLSVMMPVYNEEQTLETIVEHVLERPEVGEVIAVDDGSTDRTWEILKRCAARLVRLNLQRWSIAYSISIRRVSGPVKHFPVSQLI